MSQVDHSGPTNWAQTKSLYIDHAGQLWRRFPDDRPNELLGQADELSYYHAPGDLWMEARALLGAWRDAPRRSEEVDDWNWDFWRTR